MMRPAPGRGQSGVARKLEPRGDARVSSDGARRLHPGGGQGSRLRLGLALALLLGCGAASAGCGYALSGRGSFLPEYIEVIGVPLFVNSTTVFDVEQALTQQVRQEFIGRGKYRVIPDATGADAVLTGTVNSVTVVPTAFNEQQQATRYAFVVVMKFEFLDVRQNKVLWENASLVFREEYDLDPGTTVASNAFFGQESNAIERLARNFARTVVSSILEAF
jgi:hypothetical protein